MADAHTRDGRRTGRPRSLRRRLLLTTAVVVFVALVGAGGATYFSLRSFLVGRVDSSLSQADRSLDDVLFSPEERAEPSRSDDAFAAVVPGAFVELRDRSGHVELAGSARREFDKVTPRLPADVAVPDRPGSVVYFETDAHGGTSTFRVRAQRTVDGGVLLVALSLDDVAHTLHTLLAIELVVAAAALVAAIALGSWLLGIGLRPLRAIEETAAGVASGDLTRRVPEDPATEVGRLGMALNTMLQRIEGAFRERTQSEDRLRSFVADASHELRTPVSAVAAYAELFERGARDRPEDLERAMRGIRVETARLTVLVDELLVLARVDEEGLRRRERVDLVALVGEAVQSASVLGPEWPLTMHAPEPVDVVGDPVALRQIVDNLLGNVRRHTPTGTATVVRVSRRAHEIVLEVADAGPGLAAAEAERVFERFYRADPSRRRAHGGSGLGLAVVAALAQAHGARTELETEPGAGATFRVVFPEPPPE